MVLVVDLDGTLIMNDLFQERLVFLCLGNPWKLLTTVYRSNDFVDFKKRILQSSPIYESSIIVNSIVVDFILKNRNKYSSIILLSASPHFYVRKVSNWIGLFDEAFGSTSINLKGIQKVLFLKNKGIEEFVYIGNSDDDKVIYKLAAEGFHFNGKKLCKV